MLCLGLVALPRTAHRLGSQEFGGDNTMVVAKRVKAARVMCFMSRLLGLLRQILLRCKIEGWGWGGGGMDATRFPRL